jgi:hypothetical protein
MTISPLQLNVFDDHGKLLCPCCGTADQFSTTNYDARGGLIGSDICGACFWEPGFDDDPMASVDAKPTIIGSLLTYRAKWKAEGYPWRGTARAKPEAWNATFSLERLYVRAPYLVGGSEDDE